MVGMDERHTVTINGMTTTAVGSIEGVLGGMRHIDEDKFGMKAREMLLTSPSCCAHPNIPLDQIYCPPH
jgi:hypothetical protein